MPEPLIRVNGVDFPDPITYKVDTEPLGSWERNANGLLVGDLIAYKTKLNLSWGMMPGSLYSLLLSGVRPFFITVRYLEPQGDAYNTKEFYASARSATLALRDDSGTNWWKDVAFNLIER